MNVNYGITLQPMLSSVTTGLPAGTALVYSADASAFVASTLANRTDLSARTSCILIRTYGGNGYGVCQAFGPIPSDVSGILPGPSETAVRVADDGTLERVNFDLVTDDMDIVGQAGPDGLFIAACGLRTFRQELPVGPTGWGALGYYDGQIVVSPNLPVTQSIPVLKSTTAGGGWDTPISVGPFPQLFGTKDGVADTYSMLEGASSIYVDSNAVRVNRLDGDTAQGNITALHRSYNIANGTGELAANIGKVGFLRSQNNATTTSTTYNIPWPGNSTMIVDVRGVFTAEGSTSRVSKTYEVFFDPALYGSNSSSLQIGSTMTESTDGSLSPPYVDVVLQFSGTNLQMIVSHPDDVGMNWIASFDGDLLRKYTL